MKLFYLGENDNDDEETEDAEDEDGEAEEVEAMKSLRKVKTPALNNLFPSAMLFFIIFGPYGVGVYNFDITSCLSVDSKGIDEQAKRFRNMNCPSNAASKFKLNNEERDREPERGISTQNNIKNDLHREDQQLLKNQLKRKELIDSFNIAVIMVNRAVNTEEETAHWNNIMNEYAKVLSPTLAPTIQPSPAPSVRYAPPTGPSNTIQTITKPTIVTHAVRNQVAQSAVKKLNIANESESIPEVFNEVTQDTSDSEDEFREIRVPITAARQRIIDMQLVPLDVARARIINAANDIKREENERAQQEAEPNALEVECSRQNKQFLTNSSSSSSSKVPTRVGTRSVKK